MGVIRVNGGIITDQMLAGSLRFFKMTGPFANTVSDGTVLIPGTELYANDISSGVPERRPISIGENKPVPGSAADTAFRVISEKCSVVQISVVGNDIHFVISGSAVGWQDDADIQAAVQAIGSITVPDSTATGTSVNLSTATVTEVSFVLV